MKLKNSQINNIWIEPNIYTEEYLLKILPIEDLKLQQQQTAIKRKRVYFNVIVFHITLSCLNILYENIF